MARIVAWIHRNPAWSVVIGVTVIVLALGGWATYVAVQQMAQDEAYQKEYHQQAQAESNDQTYTPPPPPKYFTDFYAKNRQTAQTKRLNEQLYALSNTVYAPDKPTSKKGVSAVAYGSFLEECTVLITHDAGDPTDVYGITIYNHQQQDSGINTDSDPLEATSALEGNDGTLQASREHASVHGLNHLLDANQKNCHYVAPPPSRG